MEAEKVIPMMRRVVALSTAGILAVAVSCGSDEATEPAPVESVSTTGATQETPGVPWSPEFSMSVSEVLSGEVAGAAAVKGFLVVDAGGARLCEALAESYPPQCGGEALPITNYEEFIAEEFLGVPVQEAQGVTWTDDVVSLLGLIVDGTLVVDPTIAE